MPGRGIYAPLKKFANEKSMKFKQARKMPETMSDDERLRDFLGFMRKWFPAIETDKVAAYASTIGACSAFSAMWLKEVIGAEVKAKRDFSQIKRFLRP